MPMVTPVPVAPIDHAVIAHAGPGRWSGNIPRSGSWRWRSRWASALALVDGVAVGLLVGAGVLVTPPSLPPHAASRASALIATPPVRCVGPSRREARRLVAHPCAVSSVLPPFRHARWPPPSRRPGGALCAQRFRHRVKRRGAVLREDTGAGERRMRPLALVLHAKWR
jgi:hypothetical protein